MDADHTDHEDYLPELPPPAAVADSLESRSWDDDVRDDDRLLIERAALTIRSLLRREGYWRAACRDARRAAR